MTDSQSHRVPRTRTATERRQKLLDSARALFVADGYAATTISAIVAGAGVAQGTFYLYFDSKQAILAELRREVFHDYERALAVQTQADRPADEQLVQVVIATTDAVVRNHDLERVFRAAESAEDTQRAALEGRARLAHKAALLYADGVRGGLFRDEDPELTAQLVVTLFDNVLYEAIAYERPAPLAPLVLHATRFVLRALGVPEHRIATLISPLSES